MDFISNGSQEWSLVPSQITLQLLTLGNTYSVSPLKPIEEEQDRSSGQEAGGRASGAERGRAGGAEQLTGLITNSLTQERVFFPDVANSVMMPTLRAPQGEEL